MQQQGVHLQKIKYEVNSILLVAYIYAKWHYNTVHKNHSGYTEIDTKISKGPLTFRR